MRSHPLKSPTSRTLSAFGASQKKRTWCRGRRAAWRAGDACIAGFGGEEFMMAFRRTTTRVRYAWKAVGVPGSGDLPKWSALRQLGGASGSQARFRKCERSELSPGKGRFYDLRDARIPASFGRTTTCPFGDHSSAQAGAGATRCGPEPWRRCWLGGPLGACSRLSGRPSRGAQAGASRRRAGGRARERDGAREVAERGMRMRMGRKTWLA